MADLDVSGGDSSHKKGPGVKKAKKLSTRVDMTPMVDLGFLLITFFIFTTTLSTPNTMPLIMPKDDVNKEDLTEVKESGVLTILLGKNNEVFYYEGFLKDDGSNFKSSTFDDIRQIIIDKKKQVVSQHVHNSVCTGIRQDALKRNPNLTQAELENICRDRDLVVVIKPNAEATYKNTIDMVDEMTINNINRFALVDITENENGAVKLTEARSDKK